MIFTMWSLYLSADFSSAIFFWSHIRPLAVSHSHTKWEKLRKVLKQTSTGRMRLSEKQLSVQEDEPGQMCRSVPLKRINSNVSASIEAAQWSGDDYLPNTLTQNIHPFPLTCCRLMGFQPAEGRALFWNEVMKRRELN